MAMAARHRAHPATYLALAATSVLLAFTFAPLAAGDPLAQICGTSGNYTANSTYQANIRTLAATLPKAASSSRTLFATNQTGDTPYVVYALALCRGDTNASACGDCIVTAFQDALQICAFNKDVTIFYDPCLLRYSNQNFLSSTTNDGRGTSLVLMNTQNVTVPFKVFDDAVGVLLNATADYAATNSSRRFASAVEAFQSFDSQNPTIYGLAQCTPDMTTSDCRSCLTSIIQQRLEYFSGKTGGGILGLPCNYRYDLLPFFNGSPLLQLAEPAVGAPPAPAPEADVTPPAFGGGRKIRGRKIAAGIACSVLLMLVILAAPLISLKKRKTIKNRKGKEQTIIVCH